MIGQAIAIVLSLIVADFWLYGIIQAYLRRKRAHRDR